MIKTLTTTAATSLLIGLGVFLVYKIDSRPEANQIEEMHLEQPLSISLDALKKISELSTAQTTLEAIVPVESSRVWLGVNLGTSSVLYRARGIAKAGINLGDFSQEDFVVEGRRVTVKLPNAKLLDVYLDFDQSEIYEASRGTLNLGPDNLDQLLDYAQKQALEEMKKIACSTLVPEAQTNSQLAIENFLKASGFEEVVFVPVEENLTLDCDSEIL